MYVFMKNDGFMKHNATPNSDVNCFWNHRTLNFLSNILGGKTKKRAQRTCDSLVEQP